MRFKTYSELIRLPTFEERFEYLAMGGLVGQQTFGVERYLNQEFYRSREWKRTRDGIFIRDCGCDLACEGHEITGRFVIHHINPITIEDIEEGSDALFDPENLITTLELTHKALHYATFDLLPKGPAERRPNDTCPWRH